MRKWSIYIPLLLLLTSCYQQEVTNNIERDSYFEITALIDSIKPSLEMENRELVKKMILDGRSEEAKATITDWEEELKIFTEANINKPVLIGSYAVNQEGDITKYEATEEDIQVRWLEVTRKGDKVKKVTALLNENNFFYGKTVSFELTLQNGKLKSYKVAGEKRLIFNDPVKYSIEAEVI